MNAGSRGYQVAGAASGPHRAPFALPGYDEEQQRVIGAINRAARKSHATRREILAAYETGAVEAHFHNPRQSESDGTSAGWRQEISSYGPESVRRNPGAAAMRFFAEARALRGQKLPPGQLAQAVQRSAFPDRYAQERGTALELYRAFKGGSANFSGGSGGGGGPTVTQPSVSREGVAPGGTGVAALVQALMERERPQVPQSSLGLPGAANLPGPPLPGGYTPVESGPPAPPPTRLEDLLSLVGQGGDVPHSTVTPGSVSGGGGGGRPVGRGGAPMRSGTGRWVYPTGKRGDIIGTPYQGTHSLGNWQSDNAVDIGVPIGTPIYAATDSVVSKTGGSGNFSGRFGGYSATLSGPHNAFFYAHMKRVAVKPGQHVRKGQLIGYTGEANGVAHLHYAQERGDPRHRVR